MNDIHQEWRELREKNGNFINHIDGELAKIEKEKRLLDEQKEQIFYEQKEQIFYDPMTCMYFKADAEGIQKLLDKQSECVAKMTADYSVLVEENMEIQKQLNGAKAQCENTVANRRRISELSQTVINLREEAKRRAEHYAELAIGRDKLAETVSSMDKTIRDLAERNDNLRYTQQGMQSKIAKQANEIRRLTEENESLHRALDIAAKDADANFERGEIKGMEEIWDELKDVHSGRSLDENQKIFGYGTLTGILSNLSPTWFISKAEEYREQEARDIQIGDEVEIFDEFCPDDDPHSDIGIVVAIDKDNPCFAVVGPNFEGCFDETDIQSGRVKKTGQHFDSIPLDYLA